MPRQLLTAPAAGRDTLAARVDRGIRLERVRGGSVRTSRAGPGSGPKGRLQGRMPSGVRLASDHAVPSSAHPRGRTHGSERASHRAIVLEGSPCSGGARRRLQVRERTRRKKVLRLVAVMPLFDGYLWCRFYAPTNPHRVPEPRPATASSSSPIFLLFALVLTAALPLFNGRSPHLFVHPEQIEVGINEVKGSTCRWTRCSARWTCSWAMRRSVGSSAGSRDADPVRGPAGHRQDLPGQGDGQAGGRALLVHLRSGVPVDVVRDDGARIRSFFKALRKAARKEGGAIGFIEEIDAIGGSRDGVVMSPAPAPTAASLRTRSPIGSAAVTRRHGERTADPDAVVRSAAVGSSACDAH